MKKVIFRNHQSIIALGLCALFCSCASSFRVQGSSDISSLDGQQLFLKVVKDQAVHNIDSCKVVHGKFAFSGSVDTVEMASISTVEENMLPLVIESGDIMVHFSSRGASTVGGTLMNDELYAFLKQYDQLQMQSMELVRKHDLAIMDGGDMDEVQREIDSEYLTINQRLDSLVTTFISNNFDNVLGTGVFMMMTSTYDYPVFTPWIDDLVSKASAYFKNDPYVKAYLEDAQRIQNIQNGLEELPEQKPKAQQPNQQQ